MIRKRRIRTFGFSPYKPVRRRTGEVREVRPEPVVKPVMATTEDRALTTEQEGGA